MGKDLQKFYNDLNESRNDPSKLIAFYDGAANDYDEIMHDSGYTATIDYCTSLLKESLEEYEAEGREILDVGCGTGKTGRSLKQGGFNAVDGVDPSKESLKVAKESGSYRKVFEGIITDTERLSSTDCSYDGVFCLGCITLGHIELTNGITEFIRILKTGGIAVYTVSTTLDKAKAMQDHVPFIARKEIEILKIEKRFYHNLDREKAYCNIYVFRKL